MFQAPTASGDGTESLTLDKEDLQAVINNMSMRLREIRESLCLKGEEKNKNNGKEGSYGLGLMSSIPEWVQHEK